MLLRIRRLRGIQPASLGPIPQLPFTFHFPTRHLAVETRAMLYLAEDRGYLTAAAAGRLWEDYKSLSKSIAAFAASLRRPD